MDGNRSVVERLFFGRDDAESDLTDGLLREGFLPTYAYEMALSGRKSLIIGRKGSGKSAICRQLAAEGGYPGSTALITPDDAAGDEIRRFELQGVTGDTASDGLARLDWSVPPGTDAVILELGANDMLRGIDPRMTREALDTILRRLTERHIAVLICGMRAAPNLGPEYAQTFERIYPELAAKYDLPLYPFFLDGVAADLSVLQHDGLHPAAGGVALIVARILPQVEALIAHVRSAQIINGPVLAIQRS